MDATCTPNSDELILRKAISEGEILLAYAASQGIVLPPATMQALVDSHSLLQGDIRDPANSARQVAFWEARQQLATAVHPVTITSLNASTQTLNRTGKLGEWLARLFGPSVATEADIAVGQFRLLAFVALSVLLATQVYWVVGTQVLAEFGPALQQIKENETKAKELAASGKSKEDNAEMYQNLEAEQLTLVDRMTDRLAILREWNSYWRWPLVVFHLLDDVSAKEKVDPYKDLQNTMFTATLAAQNFERYVLPLLYGFLGACLYVLRTLASDIKALAYSPEQSTLYRLRVYMGTLAGLIVIWFLPSPASYLPDAGNKVTHSLTPFALAFLAGYSVDLLFALMDKFIAAFSAK